MSRPEEAFQDLGGGNDLEFPHPGDEINPDPEGSNSHRTHVPVGAQTEALPKAGHGDQGNAVDPGGRH